MKTIKTYKIPLLITLGLFVFHLCQKDFKNPYERPIAGDAQAYYAYLPALFIYHDLGYDFVDEINEKYYPIEHQKSFLKPAGKGLVNKTFPGVALLYLPFFLLAHALALLFGFDPDGYSTVYQVCFDLGLWFYLSLALVFMKRVLEKLDFRPQIVTIAMVCTVLGTNIVFYSVYDQSVTHIYNLFLVNIFVWLLLLHKANKRFNYLLYALMVLALMIITRPTNVLVLGLALFLIPDLQYFRQAIKTCFNSLNFVKLLLFVGPILFIPFILWKFQTGNWLVYSYGEEGFDFRHPHFVEFLFSYIKGWFTYTPMALLIMVMGFITLFKSDKKRFIIGFVFLCVLVYIFSSWWCWYYGAGMSQRVMIDYSILLTYLLAIFLDKSSWTLSSNKFKQLAIYLPFSALIFINFTQAYQIRYGILPGGSATAHQYWDNFLVFERRARIYPHSHWTCIERSKISLSNPLDTSVIKGPVYQEDRDKFISVNEYDHYSASLYHPFNDIRKGSKIIYKFEARAHVPIKETRAVVYFGDQTFVFGLDAYLKINEWIRIEFMVEPTESITSPFQFYFWNGGSSENVDFKNVEVEHYFSKEYL